MIKIMRNEKRRCEREESEDKTSAMIENRRKIYIQEIIRKKYENKQKMD